MPLLRILRPGLPDFTCPIHQRLELGRQDASEPGPFVLTGTADAPRLVIAAREDVAIGRRQLRIEVLNSGHVRFTNLNKSIPIGVDLGGAIAPGQTSTQSLPVVLLVGSLTIRIDSDPVATNEHFESLGHPTLAPGPILRTAAFEAGSLAMSLRAHDGGGLLQRLERLVQVLQIAASSPEFPTHIAEVTLEMVELDHAAVLLRADNNWKTVALAARNTADANDNWRWSRTLLDHVARSRTTSWRGPQELTGLSFSNISDVAAVVAAPILNAAGDVIGAIYGDRRTGLSGGASPLGPVDAQLIEILACGVANGFSRVDQERAALERRVQLERFVTPEIARQLEANPTALLSRDAEVTLLFCDIAGFSRILERLTPEVTFAWINDVMETLSACVQQHGGTLVDYVGDELIAMWGAPLPMEQHAISACRAAVDMLRHLEPLNERWAATLQDRVEIGIGINSGTVRVGNTGSQLKWKYGPLGSAVNIASRVQGATRHLRTQALITAATAELVGNVFPTRRVTQVRVKNIEQPLDLFELHGDPPAKWGELASEYKLALDEWERGQLTGAIRRLSQLVASFPDDGPSLVLLSRAIEVWSQGQTTYDPVWTLRSK
ncbi:hypothetical protein GC163_20370 [bacterium]|nr:hypothetical protein [bacterium]